MSATPFFQSAGRGDLKFWGEDDKPTESLSESEQEQWSEEIGKSKDWVDRPRKNSRNVISFRGMAFVASDMGWL